MTQWRQLLTFIWESRLHEINTVLLEEYSDEIYEYLVNAGNWRDTARISKDTEIPEVIVKRCCKRLLIERDDVWEDIVTSKRNMYRVVD